MSVRVTHQAAEVITTGNADVNRSRITQQVVEVVYKLTDPLIGSSALNDKDAFMQTEAIRLDNIILRPQISTSGDHSGTLLNVPVSDVLSDLNLNKTGLNGNVFAINTSSGTTTTTQNLTNKPGTSTAPNVWKEFTDAGGTWVFQAWRKDV